MDRFQDEMNSQNVVENAKSDSRSRQTKLAAQKIGCRPVAGVEAEFPVEAGFPIEAEFTVKQRFQ